MGEQEEKLISEFNDAVHQINRLHNIWVECKALRERGMLIQYKWKLDSATIELWVDAVRMDNDDDKNKYVSQIQDKDKDIESAEKKGDFPELYKLLIQKEKLLREIQGASGKGAKLRPYEDDFM